MRHIESAEALKALVGQEMGITDWLTIDQRRIDLFAEASGDRQWIHVDAARCRAESPYGTTIAHGYLSLALVPALMESAISLRGFRIGVNYGLNRLRFPYPVPVNSRLRLRMVLLAAEDFPGGLQTTWQATLDIEGEDKPACVAEPIYRHYF